MFHDADARHLDVRLEIAQRSALSFEEEIEEQSSGGIRECSKHQVVVHQSPL